ncbi:MBL fold metallo-hydrolase [Vibrio splendidus]|uniref:MBL fold metallo-hydrolase n=1 Tax=Vibrio splendidus TaxID=29497 RepID=UPI0011B50E76|nr:MBL fold metallo-hydrolase [Vibrio splendidus]UOE89796.1 MBL fold metallo-hydrolase [Vibrio splendidus]
MKSTTFLAASLVCLNSAYASETNTLTFDIYKGDENSFNVTSTVVYGPTEVMVFDTGFTKADALQIAAKVYESGKTLSTIFISQADPDYYFGAETLHQLFPDADIVTTPAVKEVIEEKLQFKMDYWSPKMGTNAPTKPYIPTAIEADSLTIDGISIEIKGTEGLLAHRPYLWIPSEKTILGNVAIYGHMHVWMADNQSPQSVTAWLNQLNEMKQLNPQRVIPGHMPEQNTHFDASHIDYTNSYINDFVAAKSKANNSQELIDIMLENYPNASEASSLKLGAKVHAGEMKW